MKKRFATALCAGLALAFVSCGSAPKPEPAQQGSEQTGAEAVKEEDTSKGAEEAPKPKADNSERLARAEGARQKAIDAGADKAAPDEFAKLDSLYDEAKRKSGEGDDMSKELDEIASCYDALAEYARALEAKRKIDENGYAENNMGEYNKGCAALSDLERLLGDDSATGAALYEKARQANISFTRVLNESLKKLAWEARRQAFAAKRLADGVYAGVSQKEKYNAAVEEFRAGDSSYSMQNASRALDHYQAARDSFQELYDAISSRLSEAEAAIKEAREASKESADYAARADSESPLEGDHIDGIESHDAVLLEDETFADPNESVEQVDSTIDGEEEPEAQAEGDESDEDEPQSETDAQEEEIGEEEIDGEGQSLEPVEENIYDMEDAK